MRILRVLRVVKISKFMQKLEDIVNIDFFQISGAILQLLFFILLIAHWGACFLFYISFNECISNGICWLATYQVLDTDIYTQYVSSFYFFIMTMTTVGFGNYNPISFNEKLYQIFCMLISCGFFAYIIGSLGKILSRSYDEESAFKEKIMMINKYLIEKDISEKLRVKIKIFLEHRLETKMEHKLDENEVLGLINKNLKEEIITEINKKLLIKFKFFNNFEQLSMKMTKIIKDETISKNEVIFEVTII